MNTYNYSKIISDEDWGLFEIIPNNEEPTKRTDIIKICEENKNDDDKGKLKNPKLVDGNPNVRKNVLKGFCYK